MLYHYSCAVTTMGLGNSGLLPHQSMSRKSPQQLLSIIHYYCYVAMTLRVVTLHNHIVLPPYTLHTLLGIVLMQAIPKAMETEAYYLKASHHKSGEHSTTDIHGNNPLGESQVGWATYCEYTFMDLENGIWDTSSYWKKTLTYSSFSSLLLITIATATVYIYHY